MPADLAMSTLLTGIARGRGSAEMLLELLAILHDKEILSDSEVQRVVDVLAAEMRDFDRELRPRETAVSLKG